MKISSIEFIQLTSWRPYRWKETIKWRTYWCKNYFCILIIIYFISISECIILSFWRFLFFFLAKCQPLIYFSLCRSIDCKTIPGIIWVVKRYLWLVDGWFENHRPIITNACPPKRAQKSCTQSFNLFSLGFLQWDIQLNPYLGSPLAFGSCAPLPSTLLGTGMTRNGKYFMSSQHIVS